MQTTYLTFACTSDQYENAQLRYFTLSSIRDNPKDRKKYIHAIEGH